MSINKLQGGFYDGIPARDFTKFILYAYEIADMLRSPLMHDQAFRLEISREKGADDIECKLYVDDDLAEEVIKAYDEKRQCNEGR